MFTKKIAASAAAISMLATASTAFAADGLDQDPEDVLVNATVNAALTLDIDTNSLTFNVTPTVNNGQDAAQTQFLTVTSNSYSGYNVKASLVDAQGTPVADQLSGTAASGNAVFTSAADGNSDNYLQFMVDVANSTIADTGAETVAAAGTEYDGATNVITTTGSGASVTNGDTITIDYDFNVDFTTIPDVYSGTLTYTLASNV